MPVHSASSAVDIAIVAAQQCFSEDFFRNTWRMNVGMLMSHASTVKARRLKKSLRYGGRLTEEYVTDFTVAFYDTFLTKCHFELIGRCVFIRLLLQLMQAVVSSFDCNCYFNTCLGDN